MCRRSINGILPLKPDFGVAKTRLPFDSTNFENLTEIVKVCQERIQENIPTFSEVS